MEPTWRSRGYLPHFDSEYVIQHVTFHLADSIPADAVARMELELANTPLAKRTAARRQQVDDWIDAGHGSCILGTPSAAGIVQDSLLHFDGERYRLLAWVVMPNHVHALLHTLSSWSLSQIVATWKSYTGRRLSLLCERPMRNPGDTRIWHREYWDRYVRDEQHFQSVKAYIHNNPVKAGLARSSELWRWSSAGVEGRVPP